MYIGLVPRKEILNSLANSSFFFLLPNNLIHFCSFKLHRISHWLMKTEVKKLISKNFGLKQLNKITTTNLQLRITTTNYKTECKNRHANQSKKASNLGYRLYQIHLERRIR